jgi:hypothetical protein
MTRTRLISATASALLSSSSHVACWLTPGGLTTPFCQAAATVSPLRAGSGRVVRNTMRPGCCSTMVASLPVASCGPV